MKHFWKGLILLLSFFLVACSSQDSGRSDQSMTGGGATTDNSIPQEASIPGESGMNLIGEKVIRTVNLQYETLSYDETIKHFANTVAEYGAFMEYSN